MYGAKDEGSFEAHAPYLREAFDEGTKATQLAEAKLQSEGLSTRQEDAEAGTLEEYATMLPFELSQRKRCTTKIVYDRSGWIRIKLSTSPATGWRRPCMGAAVYLFINQRELLGEHRGVEASGRKGRGSEDESKGAQLPKSQASARMEVDSKECHSAAEVDLPIVKKGTQMQSNG
ncbi:hypothetical protein BHE74_00027166 [Ensete ventricosum]|uniref:Uncharacterized protein n=1 Tax=Ensete ventricosum TaxID=4639 RepID=A0A445MHG3_ENSVE|nr:hypothetical protein BHE74_00027166 [Ensete ventricosum]RZR73690.1 hypothetical protein BHM03_00027092 [Ensete ventricosum]